MQNHRRSSIAVIFSCFVLLTIGLFSSSIPQSYAASSTTLIVPSQYSTIQSAINAANSGDTVKVLRGTYTEQLFINKSITLLGAGASSTVINEPKKLATDSFGYYWGVHIAHGAEVTISGFSFTTPPKFFKPCTVLPSCGTIGVDGGASLELSSSIVHLTYLTAGLWVGLGDTPSSVPFSTGQAVVNAVDFEVPSTATKNLTEPGAGYAGIWLSGDGSLQVSYSRIVTIPTFYGDTFGIFLDTGTTASILHNTIVGASAIVTEPDAHADISYNTLMPTGLSLFGAIPSATTGISISQGSNVKITYNTITSGPNVLAGSF